MANIIWIGVDVLKYKLLETEALQQYLIVWTPLPLKEMAEKLQMLTFNVISSMKLG